MSSNIDQALIVKLLVEAIGKVHAICHTITSFGNIPVSFFQQFQIMDAYINYVIVLPLLNRHVSNWNCFAYLWNGFIRHVCRLK